MKLAASLNGDFISKNEPCVSTKQISASIYPVAAKVVIERYGAADHLRGLVPIWFRSFESDTRHQEDRTWHTDIAANSDGMQRGSR